MISRFGTALCLALGWVLTLSTVSLSAQQGGASTDTDRQLARNIFRELVEINTTDSVGSVTAAAEAMQRRLLDAGFPAEDLHLLGPNDRKKNLVARYRGRQGSALKPVLIICHLDVVEARREDWTTDPFKFVEKDGYFYGRGTYDMKDSDAASVAAFIRLRHSGFVPVRDIILALTADEEGGKSNGVAWLLQNHRDLVDAEFAINPDAGGLTTVDGKAVALDVEASEKTYADFLLLATAPGGHSSEPMPGNPIYRIATALGKLETTSFPFELNEVTRAQFAALSKVTPGKLGVEMQGVLKTPTDSQALAALSSNRTYNPLLRTTCVATMMNAGHAFNALPQQAQANVNCRILPGHTQEQVRQDLIKIFADPQITVKYVSDSHEVSDTAPDRASAPPPPLISAVFDPLKQTLAEFWPNVPIIPSMEAGASDSIYTTAAGIPSYGIAGMAMDRDENRAHGKDERIRREDFDRGVDFFTSYLRNMTK